MKKPVKLLVKGLVKAPIRMTATLLECFWFVSPIKSKSSFWHECRFMGIRYFSDHESNGKGDNNQPVWHKYKCVSLPGVCVLSKAKVMMCRPSAFKEDDLGYRKAIVFTNNYRPLTYPGATSLFKSIDFFSSNFRIFFRVKKIERYSGRVVLLGNHGYVNNNYYHFWADVMADIWYIRKSLPKSEWPSLFLVPFSGIAWQWDILRLCGLHDEQVIPYSRHDFLSIEKLIIPVRDKGAVNLPPWLSSAIHHMSGWSPKTEKGERSIFVSRADAARRRVANEAVIRERLVQKGFEVYTLDGLSFKEQQDLFSSASIICSPHGAALTNIVWCGPGTVVIDILSENHLIPCFKELAKQNEVVYYPIVCQQIKDGDAGIEGDIKISDQQVEIILGIVDNYCSHRVVS